MELLPAFAIMLRRVGVSGMRAVVQRSITFGGRKTSVTLEDAFWEALKEIAYSRRMTISDLVREIDAQRRHNNLSSAIRLFVLEFYRSQIPNPADREGVPG
jgi:predicted DNA-binding ribbon-helix-helix protein